MLEQLSVEHERWLWEGNSDAEVDERHESGREQQVEVEEIDEQTQRHEDRDGAEEEQGREVEVVEEEEEEKQE